MSYKPLIGLTMRLDLDSRRFYLGRDYSEALAACGALPVHLALIPDENYISSVLDKVDGLLLPGSDSDVDPEYYGEDPLPGLGRVVPEKDQTEMLVLKHAEEKGIPVIAICYGMQALNVSRGGSLIQDIRAQVEGCIKHEQGVPLERNSHRIEIAEGSMLYELADKEFAKVNSHHHQAIGRVGNNLKAVAHTSDGVIEFIEDSRGDRFAIGVQWHPELSWKSDDLSQSIFERFVAECRKIAAAGSRMLS